MAKKKDAKKVDFIIDATNVCSWHKVNINNQSKNAAYSTSLNVILKLTNVLSDKKKTFKCIFDASTPYKLPEEEQEIYRTLLQVFERAFYQVTGGQKADDWVLALGDKFGAKVISTDRFRDFQSRYKWLANEDERLVKGGIMDMMDELTMVLPSLNITESIVESSEQLFIQLAKKMGLENKLSFKSTGRIKSFNSVNQYGFIYATDTKEEVYFKESDFKIIPDILVNFDLFRDGKKIFAKNVVPVIAKDADASNSNRKENKNNKKEDKADKVEGQVEWFNTEKGFGLISRKDKEESYMFKLDNFNTAEEEPKPKMKVIFNVQSKNGKSYAYNVCKGTLGKKQDAEKEKPAAANSKTTDNSGEFKQKVSSILPQLNIKLNGKINNIKGSYGFISMEDADSALFFKLDGKEDLKSGDKVQFLLGVNDHGLLAVDVSLKKKKKKQTVKKEEEPKEEQTTKAEVKEEKKPQPKPAARKTTKKVVEKVEEAKVEEKAEVQEQAKAKKTITLKTKAAENKDTEEKKSTTRAKRNSAKKEEPTVAEIVEEVVPVVEKEEVKSPVSRKRTERQTKAEATEKTNKLEALPGEKLSRQKRGASAKRSVAGKPVVEKTVAEKPATEKTVVENSEPEIVEAEKKEAVEVKKTAASKRRSTSAKSSTRKTTTKAKPVAEEKVAETTEEAKVEEKVEEKPVAKKTTRAKKTTTAKTTTRKTTRKTSGATKKAIATKPRRSSTRKSTKSVENENPVEEQGKLDLEVPFIVTPPEEV